MSAVRSLDCVRGRPGYMLTLLEGSIEAVSPHDGSVVPVVAPAFWTMRDPMPWRFRSEGPVHFSILPKGELP